MGAVKLFDPENLRSVSTACTYPLEAERLARAVEEVVWDLPRWGLARSGERGMRAVRPVFPANVPRTVHLHGQTVSPGRPATKRGQLEERRDLADRLTVQVG
jgi:hypothetical protein